MGNETHTYCLYPDSLPEWGVASIILAEDETGLLFFPVRTLCLGLGIDSPTQAGVIRGDVGLRAESRDIELPAGRNKQPMLCLTKTGVAKWFARIDANRVGKHARGRIKEYQDDLWALAERLVFTRKRVSEAGADEGGQVVEVTGALSLTIDCDCGRTHVVELRGDVARVWHLSPAERLT
jgi:hypothetical protein